MTPEQISIAEWLEHEVPGLQPAFVTAIKMMEEPDFPGRSNLVCHACRDICTDVQQYLGVEQTDRANATMSLNKLDVLWSQEKLNDQITPIASSGDLTDPGLLPEDIAVPKQILQAIQAVLEEHRRGGINQKAQAINMFQILAPEAVSRPDLLEPHANQWKDLRYWFNKHAHFSLEGKSCDEMELSDKVSLLETHLITMRSTFYAGVAEIDKILVANPTPEMVSQLIVRMAHPEQQRYFFDRLDNPEWIPHLAKKGMFNTLPPVGSNDWPPGRYLSRMASIRPAEIAKIFYDLPPTDNPHVVQEMLKSAVLLPSEISLSLVPKIVKTLDAPFWFTAELAGALAVTLAKHGQHKASLEILKSLLQVIPDPRGSLDPGRATGRKHEAVSLLRGFDYANLIRSIGKDLSLSLGLSYLSLLCGLLRSALGEELTVDATTKGKTEDYSFVWQARLEGSSFHESAKHLLIPAILASGDAISDADVSNLPGVIAKLGKFRFKVYDRIAFCLLAKYTEAWPLLATERLLNKDSFLDLSVRQEFDALVAVTFPYLSAEGKDTYLGWIDEGGDPRRFQGSNYTKEAIESATEYWKWQRLSPISSFLPTGRIEGFAVMESKFGGAKPYSNPIAQGGAYSISDESPLNQESLAAMGTARIMEHLRRWEPTPNDPFPFGTSREGLGIVLAAVVADNPGRFTSAMEEMKSLRPVYVTSFLRGFDSAIRLNKPFNLKVVLALALWIAEQPATPAGENGADVNEDFSTAKHNVIDFVHEGLKNQKFPPSEETTIWTIIDLLSEDEWGTLDYRNPTTHTEDAWFHSLNYLHPKAVRAAFQYLQWRMKTAGDSKFTFSSVPELAHFFDRHSDPDHDPCLSVRLIFGEKFPYLHALDEAWAISSVSRIFPNDTDQATLRDVAWTAYLVANEAYNSVFALLEPQYRSAIGIPDENRLLGKSHMLEHPSSLMSHHFIQQYWRGKLSLNPESLLGEFFLKAGERARRAAIIYIGRSLRETTDDVEPEIIERFVTFWENRTEAATAGGASGEMMAFSWWFFTEYFDDEWALENLHTALKLTGGQLDMIMTSLDRLSELAGKYPGMAIDCMQLIAAASPEYIELWTLDVIAIIKAGLFSGDKLTREKSRHLIEELGTKGHWEFRKLLDVDLEPLGIEQEA